MHVRVWEYEVAPERRAAFVEAYGADGAWAALFRQGEGYIRTELLCSVERPDRFVTVDRWADEESWRRFLEAHRAAYDALDARLADLTLLDRRVLEGPTAP